jgi:inhibitor of cysteine peptidase
MKKQITILLSLFLVLLFLAGCAVQNPTANTAEPSEAGTAPVSETVTSSSPDTAPSETAAETTEPITGMVAIETEKYEYASDYIDVKLEVPKLSGLHDSAVQDRINAVFDEILSAAKESVKPAEEESKAIAAEYGETLPYMTQISYGVPYNKDGILSIVISDYRYLGGAHGGDFWSPYTFDLKTGKQLSLDNLMAEDSGYRELINSSIRKEIDRRAEANELMENAEFEDIGDDPAYYLTSNAVVFYFQQYEYFPYAAGIQEFQITYADLKDMLKEDYASLAIETVILNNTADNQLEVGNIGQIVLQGNPTTGYSWHCAISDTGVLELSGEQYQSDSAEDAVGAGGTYTWDFRALEAGTAEITCKYYRDWLGESDTAPEDTVTYTVVVK